MESVMQSSKFEIPYRAKKWLGRIALYFSVFIVVSPALFVFLWMLSLSLKNEIDNIAYPPVFIPNPPTFANYFKIFRESNYVLYAYNSVIVSGSATLFALLVGVPAGYGIAKGKAQGLGMLIMIARITPGLSYLIPLFTLFRFIGISGSLLAVAISHLVITIPMVVWVMISFFEDMHPELEEAALVDGCNIWQAFYRIAMPIARPGIAVAAILAFIQSWNNFLFGVVLAGRETRTLPIAVFNAMTFEQLSWGPVAAAALVVTLPSLLLTIFVQRDIVTGLAAGSVKG
ncbi:Trehalose transport system permease protein SugB [Anaerolineae bacterium]|nr:Trehalose transport system permease protein SugB [Anaerolineae bacterium]